MKFTLLLLAMLILLTHQQLTSLPISSDLVLKLSLSMSKLQNQLQYFGTYQQNKYHLYKRVMLTKKYLGQLNDQLCKYNNVILGNGNAAKGNKNIIIGNYNNVTGSNNWVFISNYTGKLNGDLLLGLWIIQIDKSNLIMINPRFAISFIDQSKNRVKKDKISKKNHKFCNWKKKSNRYRNYNQNSYNDNKNSWDSYKDNKYSWNNYNQNNKNNYGGWNSW